MSIEIRNFVTENLKIDQAPAASGYIPVADATGLVTLTAPANITGIGSANIISGIAGEALANRDLVTLTGGIWKRVSTTLVMTPVYGFVNQAGGAALNAAVAVQISGTLSGFTGLTANAYVYMGGTAGVITQTRPDFYFAGSGTAYNPVGYASSTTQILVLPGPVIMAAYATLPVNGVAAIGHTVDTGLTRRLRAYIKTSNATPATTYASSNQDSDLDLGWTGAPMTTSGTDTGSFLYVGNSSGTNYARAQSFQIAAGTVTQFTIGLGANTGTPSGTITWKICTDSSSLPGSTLATGTFTPTANAINTVSVSGGPTLAAATTYWLVFTSTSVQATGVTWSVICSSSPGTYANGVSAQSSDNGATWGATLIDLQFSVTVLTGAGAAKSKLAQSFTIAAPAQIAGVNLWLKKSGSPAGTLTIRIETDAASYPSGTLVHPYATATLTETSLTTSYVSTNIPFPLFTLAAATTYHIVITTTRANSATNYISWGVDTSASSYSPGAATYVLSGTNTTLAGDAIFDVISGYLEVAVLGRNSTGTRDLGVWFGDPGFLNPTTTTSFKNVTGSAQTFLMFVELDATG